MLMAENHLHRFRVQFICAKYQSQTIHVLSVCALVRESHGAACLAILAVCGYYCCAFHTIFVITRSDRSGDAGDHWVLFCVSEYICLYVHF